MNLLSSFNLLHTMKKFDLRKMYVASMVALGSAVSALAEEGSTTTTTVADSLIDSAQGSLEGILTSAGTAVSGLVVAGLAIWGAIAIIGVLKRAFNAGKGR